MKKIVVSVGLVALGAAAAHAQYAPGLAPQDTSKSWALSASLRGFYDDNYLTLPKTIPGPVAGTYVQGAHSSFGFEVSPSVSFNHSVEDTLLSASYVYDLRYYEDQSVTDQTHQFNAKLDHEFSERYKIQVSESFVVAQEPTVIDPSLQSTPLRVQGNNIRNTGSLDFTAVLTRLFDVHVGYANSLYAYQQHADEAVPGQPSYSALLDRMDQLATIDLRWKALPETTGVFGYQYEHVDYTSPEYIIYPGGIDPAGSRANTRDTDSHFAFVGADESFTPDLNGSLRVGAEYVDYYNSSTSEVSPYADASLTYQYMPQSSVQVGVKHVHNATDVAGIAQDSASPVLDEESTAAYASVSHRVTSRFTASALAQAQYSTFDGGGALYNNKGEDFYILGINFAYHFTEWFTGETGYNYNKLNSDLSDRSYTRNQCYIGIRATY